MIPPWPSFLGAGRGVCRGVEGGFFLSLSIPLLRRLQREAKGHSWAPLRGHPHAGLSLCHPGPWLRAQPLFSVLRPVLTPRPLHGVLAALPETPSLSQCPLKDSSDVLSSHPHGSAHPTLQPGLGSEFRYQLCPLLGPCVPSSRTRDKGGVPLKFCGQGRICTVPGIHESPYRCYLL